MIAPLALMAVTLLFARWLTWPGVATHDSLAITREALKGTYTTHHPLLNALLLRFLAVPFDSYAPYTTVQMLVCAVLFARAVMLITADRPERWLPLASVVIWSASLHTYLYLAIVWKDVLAAYSIAFLSAVIFHLRSRPEREIARLDAWLLGVALFLASTLRHGMWFAVLLVPVVIGLRRTWTTVRIRTPILYGALGFLLMQALSSSSFAKDDPAHILRLKISVVSQPFLGIVAHPNGFTSDDYARDRILAERVFGPQYKESYTSDYFRNEVVLTDRAELESAYRAMLSRMPELCVLNVSQCITGRVQMMLSTLQPSTRFKMVFYDLGAASSCAMQFGMDEEQCAVLERFESAEKPELAKQWLTWITRTMVDKRNALHNLYAWNLLPAFGLLLGVLLLSSARSPLWQVAAFVGAQCALPFATVIANDFRYYYFLALYFAIFAPLTFVEAWRVLRKPPS